MGAAESSPGDSNRLRAEHVLRRHASEGHDPRDMNPRWFLGAVQDANRSEVIFAKRPEGRGGSTETMGVAVVKDRPENSSLEIRGVFGPGMGSQLFNEADCRARAAGRRLIVADVTPGARDAYRARGFASAGSVGQDGAYPMSREVLPMPPAPREAGASAFASQAPSARGPGAFASATQSAHFSTAAASRAAEPAVLSTQGPTWSRASREPLRTIRTAPSLERRGAAGDDYQIATRGCRDVQEPGFWSCIFPCLDRSWH